MTHSPNRAQVAPIATTSKPLPYSSLTPADNADMVARLLYVEMGRAQEALQTINQHCTDESDCLNTAKAISQIETCMNKLWEVVS